MAKTNMDKTCPIARTLDIVGSRWTLLIIRDLLTGAMRFQDFQERLPGIAPNVLSDRLKILEEQGIVRREFYSDHPPRATYALTDSGQELGVVVLALARWGVTNLNRGLKRSLQHEKCFKLLGEATEALRREPVRRRKAA